MNLQTVVTGLAAPGVGHADALAYASAYLLSSGVEIVVVSVAAALLVRYAGRGLWNVIAGRLPLAPTRRAGHHASHVSA